MKTAAFFAAALAACASALADGPALAKRVDVTSYPEGAAVVVDGSPRGRTPVAMFDIAPGRHHISFSMPGYERADEFFSVGDGGYASSHVDLVPQKGLLLVTTEPAGCALSIDGVSFGETPRLVTTLDVTRRHRMELRKTGYQPCAAVIAFSGRTPLVRHERLVLDSGKVTVESDPPGAAVFVNGIERGVTPLVVGDIPRGRLAVKLKLAGYRDVVRELNIKPGDSQNLSVAMEGLPGGLVLTSVPSGARIYVDGSPRGKAPVEIAPLAPGRHTVLAQLEGYGDEERSLDVGRGETVRTEFRLESVLGRLELRTAPVGATVVVDGRLRGRTTAGSEAAKFSDCMVVGGLEAGVHTLRLSCHGHAELTKEFKVEAKRATALDLRMKRVFTPDVVIDTASVKIKGEFVGEDSSTITVETSPGVQRTFKKSDVRIIPIVAGKEGQ